MNSNIAICVIEIASQIFKVPFGFQPAQINSQIFDSKQLDYLKVSAKRQEHCALQCANSPFLVK